MARFMPQNGDAYDDVYEMSGSGTPRYSAPEVIFHHPYNLKSDVYSFSVVLWEIMCLKKPFAQYKQMKDKILSGHIQKLIARVLVLLSIEGEGEGGLNRFKTSSSVARHEIFGLVQ